MASAFSGAIEFLGDIGLYDVVLPFLLTFVIVFAILEKTKILGTEKVGGTDAPKKNLNSLVAFVMGFFVVASSEIVGIINAVAGQIVLLLLVSVFYLLLIGTFFKKDEDVFLEKGPWRTGFMIATLVGIILIFASVIPANNSQSWLEWIWVMLTKNFNSPTVSVIALLLFLLIVVMYTMNGMPAKAKEEKKKDE